MAGPYCRDCKHYYPAMLSKDTGECMDPTKRIYYKYGDAKNEPREVHETDTCRNWDGGGGEETSAPAPRHSPSDGSAPPVRIK